MTDQTLKTPYAASAIGVVGLSVVRGLGYAVRRGKLSEIDPSRFKYPPGSTAKPCTRCKVTKPLSAYNVLKKGALGYAARCKDCINAIGLAYTKRSRELRATRPRPTHCEVCGRPPGKRALSLDHCHASGQFRGWLCSACNHALGHVNDSIHTLKALIAYLERQQAAPCD